MSTVSILAGIIASSASLAYWIGRRLTLLEARIGRLEEGIGRLEARVERLEGEVVKLRERVNELEARIGRLEERVDRLEARVKELEGEVKGLGARVDRLEATIAGLGSRLRRLGEAFVGYQEFFVSLLADRGVVDEGAVRLAREAVEGLVGVALANPLPREKLLRLKQLLEKDFREMSLEEAEELLDLAREFAWEYGGKAWRVHIYAAMVYGYLLARAKREKEKRKAGSEGEGR